MFGHGIARSGYIEVPQDSNLVYDFLRVEWRTIQHYGVERGGLRYAGSVLTKYANRQSPYRGRPGVQGKWPIHVDPDDVSRVYFRDPEDGSWHTLAWEHHQAIASPFSDEALAYARRLAAQRDRFADVQRTLTELLDRWNVGLWQTPAERRMALRLGRERVLELPEPVPVGQLPSVRAALGTADAYTLAGTADATPVGPGTKAPTRRATEPDPIGGDDDNEDDIDTDLEEFYSDAMEPLE
jgi:hypothetical protein